MKADNKHFKFINSQTGNTIFYHSCNTDKSGDELKAELDKVKAQVASNNGLFLDIVYWEEVKDQE